MNSETSKTSEPYVLILKLTDQLDSKAGFQHANFSASAEFFTRAHVSAYRLSNFLHNSDSFKIKTLKDLDKIKIANTSNNKFLIVACETGLLLLN